MVGFTSPWSSRSFNSVCLNTDRTGLDVITSNIPLKKRASVSLLKILDEKLQFVFFLVILKACRTSYMLTCIETNR